MGRPLVARIVRGRKQIEFPHDVMGAVARTRIASAVLPASGALGLCVRRVPARAQACSHNCSSGFPPASKIAIYASLPAASKLAKKIEVSPVRASKKAAFSIEAMTGLTPKSGHTTLPVIVSFWIKAVQGSKIAPLLTLIPQVTTTNQPSRCKNGYRGLRTQMLYLCPGLYMLLQRVPGPRGSPGVGMS